MKECPVCAGTGMANPNYTNLGGHCRECRGDGVISDSRREKLDAAARSLADFNRRVRAENAKHTN